MDRKIVVKKFSDNYFYKAINIFPDYQLDKLNQSSVHWIESTRKDIVVDSDSEENREFYPPESSSELTSYKNFIEDDLWISYLECIKAHTLNYCKLTEIAIPERLLSTHIKRVADIEISEVYSKEYLKKLRTKRNPMGTVNNNKSNRIRAIFYLKNPDIKYGTVIKLENNKIFKNDGEENSIIIFNPELYHAGLYPTEEDLQISPQITIICDFV